MSVALHHRVDGDGPALLLGPSLGTTLSLWDRNLAELAGAARVVRFDHRGHGGSPAPPGPYWVADLAGDVLALMDRLGIERASYCGVSLGGMIGIWLAAHAPERIERLVVLCSSAHLPPAAGWAERAATVRAAASTEPIAEAVTNRWLTPDFAAANPELLAALRAMLLGADAEGYARCCEAIAALDLRGELGRIVAPTLVVSAREDLATPPPHGERIAAAVPGARFELLSPAAHLAGFELPGETNALIFDHLKEAKR